MRVNCLRLGAKAIELVGVGEHVHELRGLATVGGHAAVAHGNWREAIARISGVVA